MAAARAPVRRQLRSSRLPVPLGSSSSRPQGGSVLGAEADKWLQGSTLATPRETGARRRAPLGAAREPSWRACLPRLAALLVA
jgi:hypothetical protein